MFIYISAFLLLTANSFAFPRRDKLVVEKEKSRVGSVDIGSVAYLILAFVLFMMGAALILTSELIPSIRTHTVPDYNIVSVLIGLVIGQVALVILTFGAYFNGDKETHGILMGFIVTLVIGVIILITAAVLVFGHYPEDITTYLCGDFSLPCYIAALFMLIGGILLFFKRGNFKLIGVTYVLVALMYVFFARAIQILSEPIINGTGYEAIDVGSIQTSLVVAGVFAIVGGLIGLYIGIAKTNIVKAPLF